MKHFVSLSFWFGPQNGIIYAVSPSILLRLGIFTQNSQNWFPIKDLSGLGSRLTSLAKILSRTVSHKKICFRRFVVVFATTSWSWQLQALERKLYRICLLVNASSIRVWSKGIWEGRGQKGGGSSVFLVLLSGGLFNFQLPLGWVISFLTQKILFSKL